MVRLSSNWPGDLPGCPGLESTHGERLLGRGRMGTVTRMACQWPWSVISLSVAQISSHAIFCVFLARAFCATGHRSFPWPVRIQLRTHGRASSEVITGNMRKVDCVGLRQIRVQSVAATPDPDPVRCGCARRGMQCTEREKQNQSGCQRSYAQRGAQVTNPTFIHSPSYPEVLVQARGPLSILTQGL